MNEDQNNLPEINIEDKKEAIENVRASSSLKNKVDQVLNHKELSRREFLQMLGLDSGGVAVGALGANTSLLKDFLDEKPDNRKSLDSRNFVTGDATDVSPGSGETGSTNTTGSAYTLQEHEIEFENTGSEPVNYYFKVARSTAGTATTSSGSGSTGSGLAGSIGDNAACELADEEFEEIKVDSDKTFYVEEGETFSNKLIDADGNSVEIYARASNFTIRNIGIINLEGSEGQIKPIVDDADGEGLVENVYIENGTNNFVFVHVLHEGHLTIRRCTFIKNTNRPEGDEDGIYGSPPGNPGSPPFSNKQVKDPGYGGTIDVVDCYFEEITGHGVRLGSPGSRCINCTIKGIDHERHGKLSKPLANYYGGTYDNYKGGKYEGDNEVEEDYVLFKDCDVGGEIIYGLQVGVHFQTDELFYPIAVELDNVSIGETQEAPIRCLTNTNGGNYPAIVNGEEMTNEKPSIDEVDGLNKEVDLTPPKAAPMSAEEAASGGYNCTEGPISGSDEERVSRYAPSDDETSSNEERTNQY